MEKAALAVWRRLAPICHRLGTLTEADVETFARYCRLRVQWEKCMAFVEEHGVSYELNDDEGSFRCHQLYPEATQGNKYNAELLKLEREFGLTPSARATVPTATPSTPSVPTRDRCAGNDILDTPLG